MKNQTRRTRNRKMEKTDKKKGMRKTMKGGGFFDSFFGWFSWGKKVDTPNPSPSPTPSNMNSTGTVSNTNTLSSTGTSENTTTSNQAPLPSTVPNEVRPVQTVDNTSFRGYGGKKNKTMRKSKSQKNRS